MESKKKVLVFIPEFPVLTETFIERELAKLIERGNVDIVIFSLRKGRGVFSDILKDRVFYQRLSFLDILKIITYTFSHLSKVSDVYRGLGSSHKVGALHFLKKVYLVMKSVGYAGKFSCFKPDLILAHFLSEPSTVAMCSSKIMGVPYAISAHAKDIMVTAEYIEEKIKTSKFITICNENAYNYVLEQSGGLDTSNIHLFYHGVDVQRIKESTSNSDYRSEKPLILAVGRLIEKKGFKYLIEAAKILKDRGLAFEVHIIGSGFLYEDLLNQIGDLGLEEEVKILGENKGLSNEETLMFFKSASIFVFPSIEDKDGDVDGVANVLLEAGVFELPVISTDAGSTREIIIDGKTGLVVPQGNSVLLTAKIEVLLKDKVLAQRLGKGIYDRVMENFDLDRSILNLENLLLQ